MRPATILLSAALLLISAAPAAAVDGTSTTTVGVAASISLSGIPATISYGTNRVAGDTPTAPFTATVTTTNLLGYSLTVLTSDMTSEAGGTIAASATSYAVSSAATGFVTACAVSCPVVDASTPVVLGTKPTSAIGGDAISVTPKLTVPSVASGTYTGTAVFTASTL